MSEQVQPETRIQATDRWRREGRASEVAEFREQTREDGRAAGLGKPEAREQSWVKAIVEFPPLPEAEVPAQRVNDSQVRGLGDIPADWGELPPNASIQAELAWVQAERLGVITVANSGATVVDLDQAGARAPSRAALGWLETSIRSYAKYVDVVARLLKGEEDEQATERRERLAIGDIEGVLAEMAAE